MNRFGRIVNIVSLSGIKGLPGQANYAAAKGGVIAATKALAQEVAKKGVTVNAIAPGIRAHGHDRRHRRGGAPQTDTCRSASANRPKSPTWRCSHLGTSLLYHGRGHFDQRGLIYLRPWRRE